MGIFRLVPPSFLALVLFVLTQAQTRPADVCGALRSGTGEPPIVKPAGEPVRVAAFGDFGDGSKRQKKVADALAAYHHARPFDFGLTLGDNFYASKLSLGLLKSGITSATHEWWESRWESMYTGLGVRFYATLGNHDYTDNDPEAELRRESASWCLPKTFYTFTAGPVQFFALDTTEGKLDRAQLEWLDAELGKSRAAWKVVYGHHPFKTDSRHGEDDYVKEKMRRTLLPLLLKDGRVDVYLAGHAHNLEYLRPEGGVQLFNAGGGGKSPNKLRAKGNRLWGRSANGFAVVEADGAGLTLRFVEADGKEPCAVTLRKGKTPELAGCVEP